MSKSAKLKLLLGLSVLAWAFVALTVITTDPESSVSQMLFFGLLFLALLCSLTLILYLASFRLFAAKPNRGSMGRSFQQGSLWAAFCVLASFMQMLRALNLLTGVLLFALFGLAGAVILTRK